MSRVTEWDRIDHFVMQPYDWDFEMLGRAVKALDGSYAFVLRCEKLNREFEKFFHQKAWLSVWKTWQHVGKETLDQVFTSRVSENLMWKKFHMYIIRT